MSGISTFDFPLPANWTAEPYFKDQTTNSVWCLTKRSNSPTVAGPVDGFVSIDFQKRIFEGGQCIPNGLRSASGEKKYNGRGWQVQLVADAVAWLEIVFMD